jgi:hypothetical protein
MPNPAKPAKVTKQSTALMKAPDAALLALLTSEFPTEPTYQRELLPRLVLVSQDITEEVKVAGRKQINVITEAGTFVIEKQLKNDDDTFAVDEETGKQIWDKTEIGDEIEGVIIFERKQLRYFDEATGDYTSSPVYDTADEIVPLFRNKAEVDRGTPAELQAKYPGLTAKGKPKSNLEENRILYVLYEGEVYQMNLRGTSMFSYMDYKRKTRPAVPAVVTHFTSVQQENGSTSWNKMMFDAVRPLNIDEVKDIIGKVNEIKESIADVKEFFAEKNAENDRWNDIAHNTK